MKFPHRSPCVIAMRCRLPSRDSRARRGKRAAWGPAAVCAMAFALLAGPAQAELFMSSPITIANPGGPIRVRTADLNADGIVDVMVVNSTGNSVSVYLGTGGGAFQPRTNYPVGAGPTDMEVLDINNDGKLDLVILDTAGNSVSVLRGNGNGTFAPAETYPVGINPTRMTTFKSSSSNLGRIVTVNTGSNSISYLVVQGNGSFGTTVNFPVGSAPNYVLNSDLDGDGISEFIVSNGGDGTITVVTRNPATGVLANGVSYSVGINPTGIASGDGNGDGKRDIIVTNAGSNTISVLFGNGDRTLQSALTFGTGPNPQQVVTADLDGDGLTDAVVRNGDGSYTVFLSKPDSTAVTYDAGGASSGFGMDVFDFDGDGKLDILGALNNDGRFSILPGNGNGTFGQARVFAAGAGPANRWSRNDLSGDGRLDLAIANTAANTISLLLQVPVPPTLGIVTEFYNTPLDNYFITADPNEAAAVDSGAAGPGWARTGGAFNFNSGGNTYVCRFYGSINPGPNSHFYTVSSSECSGLKALQAATLPTQKRWNFESLDFVSTVPVNGACPTGTVPVYRAYNNGFTRGVDSNHRITVNQAGIAAVVARGWVSEGVVMCAPS